MPYDLTVNGKAHSVDLEGDTPLLWVLRDTLGYRGVKFGCGAAQCGACTVHLDGRAAPSCQLLVQDLAGAKITTIEGVGGNPVGRAVQAAWIAHDVPQCGYCQAGQIMSASALLATNPRPTDDDIDAAMSRNLCRCGTYPRIRRAIQSAAAAMTNKGA